MHLMQLDGQMPGWLAFVYVYDKILTYRYEDINEKELGRVHM